jgi:hypothetical protein
VAFVWDSAKWDQAEWQGKPPGQGGWGTDWRWWFQYGTQFWYDLTGLVVEARWTTDGHTLGDGTFRGDLQPGTCTMRLWDPGHLLDNLPKMGCVFAHYAPTGATWCWFYESFTRGLYAPGDPTDADCVYVGDTWPPRLTSNRLDTNYPAQSAAARLTAAAATMATPGMILPAVSAFVAAQTQGMAAAAANSNDGSYPGVLPAVRDAAAPGLAWLAATAPSTARAPGALEFHYARWDAVTFRGLDRSQVIAGPAVSQDVAWIVTTARFEATAADGTQTAFTAVNNQTRGAWGYQGPTMRMVGNVAPIVPQGPEFAACNATAAAIYQAFGDPTEQYLSSVDVQSGARTTPTGGPSPAGWDPYAHTFAPTEVLTLTPPTPPPPVPFTTQYRVVKSDHRLTATVWQTTHTLEKYVAPTALP